MVCIMADDFTQTCSLSESCLVVVNSVMCTFASRMFGVSAVSVIAMMWRLVPRTLCLISNGLLGGPGESINKRLSTRLGVGVVLPLPGDLGRMRLPFSRRVMAFAVENLSIL